MKMKIFNFHLVAMALVIVINVSHAQSLDVDEISIELSKEAKKAQKKRKSTFTDLGMYWNSDRTELYKVFTYQIKDEPKMYEIFTIDEKGEIQNRETAELTPGSLQKYKLEPAESLLENKGPDISKQQYGYFRRSALAGRPTLNIGHFEDRYFQEVWFGYSFKEDEDYKLEERFWPDFSFAVEGTNLENTSSHLLKKRTALGKVLQGQRNYIPIGGTAVLGGLMATSEQDTYLTGIYDLNKRVWEVKYENKIESKINQTGGSTEKDDQQGAYSLLVCDKGYLLLDIGPKGKVLHKTWLDLENTQKTGMPENWDLQVTDDGGVLIFHTIADGYSTTKSAIAMFGVRDGKAVHQSYLSFDEQEEKLVQAPKSKVKYKRVTGFMIDKLERLPNGEWALLAHTHKPEVLNVLFHLNENLSLAQLYTIDAVPHIMEKATEEAFAGFIPGMLYPAGDGTYYWITRDTPGRLLPGIHTSKKTKGDDGLPGSVVTTTYTTLRIDEVYAYFKVVKVDLNQGTIGKPFYPEKLLSLGGDPGELSKNGNLFMNVMGSKSGEYYNLVLK